MSEAHAGRSGRGHAAFGWRVCAASLLRRVTSQFASIVLTRALLLLAGIAVCAGAAVAQGGARGTEQVWHLRAPFTCKVDGGRIEVRRSATPQSFEIKGAITPICIRREGVWGFQTCVAEAHSFDLRCSGTLVSWVSFVAAAAVLEMPDQVGLFNSTLAVSLGEWTLPSEYLKNCDKTYKTLGEQAKRFEWRRCRELLGSSSFFYEYPTNYAALGLVKGELIRGPASKQGAEAATTTTTTAVPATSKIPSTSAAPANKPDQPQSVAQTPKSSVATTPSTVTRPQDGNTDVSKADQSWNWPQVPRLRTDDLTTQVALAIIASVVVGLMGFLIWPLIGGGGSKGRNVIPIDSSRPKIRRDEGASDGAENPKAAKILQSASQSAPTEHVADMAKKNKNWSQQSEEEQRGRTPEFRRPEAPKEPVRQSSANDLVREFGARAERQSGAFGSGMASNSVRESQMPNPPYRPTDMQSARPDREITAPRQMTPPAQPPVQAPLREPPPAHSPTHQPVDQLPDHALLRSEPQPPLSSAVDARSAVAEPVSVTLPVTAIASQPPRWLPDTDEGFATLFNSLELRWSVQDAQDEGDRETRMRQLKAVRAARSLARLRG